MNSYFSSQRLLFATAWVGTAIGAYSIGSLRTAPSGPTPALVPSKGAAGAESSRIDAAFGANAARPFEQAHNSTHRTLSEIINGQPLDDYLQRVLALEDEIPRTSAFLELLSALNTAEDLRVALEVVAKSGRGGGRGTGSREYSMLLQKWTALEPKGAAEYAKNVEGRDSRSLALSNVLRTWTRTDATAALAWAQANGVPTTGTPEELQRIAAEGNSAVAMVVSQLARTNLDLAMNVASSDGDSRAITRLGDDLADELFKQRGEQGTRDAILSMPESKLRDTMIGEHADRLANIDSPGAAQWAATLAPGGGRSRALAEAISEWADDDAAAAGNFLNSLPPSSDSDAARERYARNVFEKDPVGALSWAASITDAGDRQQTSERLVRTWLRRDAESAKSWVMQSTFPDALKQQLLAPANAQRERN